jgi:hypothetical protein
MAARLSHPGIAAVHDYREAIRPDGTVVPFVVMELLTGESVAARVDRELIGWPEAARIGAAVADALAAAHASGVVHRDIKPGNVMLTPNGVKILDFGISVAAGEPDDDDTGATFGTPAYVAPERLDGMPAEPVTDVYGVGVLLFEMVTGDPPYPVETWEELAAARASGPSELPESLPADFRDVINRCLDPDPAGRPTAARLRADLLAVALRSRPPAPEAGAAVPSAQAGDELADGAAAQAGNGPEANRVAQAGDGRPAARAAQPAVHGAAGAQPAPTGDGHEAAGAARPADGAPAPRVGASGAIGNLVRAAGVSADRWGAAGGTADARGGPAHQFGAVGGQDEPTAHPGAAGRRSESADEIRAGGQGEPWAQPETGGSAGETGAGGARRAGDERSGAPSSARAARRAGDGHRGAPSSAGVGAASRAESGRAGSGRNTPADDRFAGAVPAGSSNGGAPYGRPGSRSPGGTSRSAFAYTDGDQARDWRPDGQEAGGGSRNFATGRASAATLDMVESPRRRTVFGIVAAVVLAALAGGFAVLTWTHRDSDRDVAVPPAATAPVVPTVTATAPPPAATSAAPTSAGPSPKASLTFADAVSRMRDAVKGGEASGQIRQDVAQDLLNLLGPLSNAQGSDLTGQVQALRQKIQTRVGEDGVTQAGAAVLQSRLEDLDRAAGT